MYSLLSATTACSTLRNWERTCCLKYASAPAPSSTAHGTVCVFLRDWALQSPSSSSFLSAREFGPEPSSATLPGPSSSSLSAPTAVFPQLFIPAPHWALPPPASVPPCSSCKLWETFVSWQRDWVSVSHVEFCCCCFVLKIIQINK